MLRKVVVKANYLPRLVLCRTLTASATQGPKTPTSPPPTQPKEVPGLSGKCVATTTGSVGPGASSTGEYKVPEYFQYNKASYFEAEVEMEKFRLPQPAAK